MCFFKSGEISLIREVRENPPSTPKKYNLFKQTHEKQIPNQNTPTCQNPLQKSTIKAKKTTLHNRQDHIASYTLMYINLTAQKNLSKTPKFKKENNPYKVQDIPKANPKNKLVQTKSKKTKGSQATITKAENQ